MTTKSRMIEIPRATYLMLIACLAASVIALIVLSNQLEYATVDHRGGRGGDATAIGCGSVAIGGAGGESVTFRPLP